MQSQRKYNDQTGNYKIDIFVNGAYYCSTDQAKTCTQAKNRIIELAKKYPQSFIALQGIAPESIKCKFFRF